MNPIKDNMRFFFCRISLLLTIIQFLFGNIVYITSRVKTVASNLEDQLLRGAYYGSWIKDDKVIMTALRQQQAVDSEELGIKVRRGGSDSIVVLSRASQKFPLYEFNVVPGPGLERF